MGATKPVPLTCLAHFLSQRNKAPDLPLKRDDRNVLHPRATLQHNKTLEAEPSERTRPNAAGATGVRGFVTFLVPAVL